MSAICCIQSSALTSRQRLDSGPIKFQKGHADSFIKGGHQIQNIKGPNVLPIFIPSPRLEIHYSWRFTIKVWPQLCNHCQMNCFSLIFNQHCTSLAIARLNTVVVVVLVVLDVTLTRSIPQLPHPHHPHQPPLLLLQSPPWCTLGAGPRCARL